MCGMKLCPFSKKQRLALGWWKGSRAGEFNGVIADGAVRSGKTVALSLGFVLWSMSTYDGQFFAVCGRSIGSVRRNVLSWLLPLLPSLGIRAEYRRSENRLEMRWGERLNTFYVFGAKDERAQDMIQGLTLAGVYFDEAALMPESFVTQATARCSVDGSKFWFSCNPLGPGHWFKTDWIDMAEEKKLLVLRFTMKDNLSLGKEVIERYEAMYSGVFYRRYILGQWCVAEGLVYPMFSEKNIAEKEIEGRVFLSCDYGTNNPFALGLLCMDGDRLHLAAEYYHDGRKNGQKTDSEYADEVERFVEEHGAEPEFIVVDPSASSFITELRRRKKKVIKAKNAVMDGIRAMSDAINSGLLTVSPSCEATIREFGEYAWDDSASDRGEDKPVKQHDHAMDMLRYALMTGRRSESASRNIKRRCES